MTKEKQKKSASQLASIGTTQIQYERTIRMRFLSNTKRNMIYYDL